MTNPFDLKAAVMAKHAQHVVLVHFPIALCMTSVAFDFLAYWRKQVVLATVAYYNLLVAAIMTLPTFFTGVLAWQWLLEGQRLKGALLLHLVLGALSTAVIWIVWWLHVISRRRREESLPTYVLAIELFAMMIVGLTAHVGGILSGVNL